MSRFGVTLRDLLEKNDFPLRHAATICGLSAGALSQISTGAQATVSRENVEAIMKLFRDDREALTALALAHLVDELPAPARSLVTIRAGGEALRGDDLHLHDLFANLDDDFERAIRAIRHFIPFNDDLRLAVIDLAKAVGASDRLDKAEQEFASRPDELRAKVQTAPTPELREKYMAELAEHSKALPPGLAPIIASARYKIRRKTK